MTRLLRGLADETRLRILALLAHGELCVCHIQEALGSSQPLISRHLGVLRHSGIVTHRRKGSWVYYRVAEQLDERSRQVVDAVIDGFEGRELLRADVARLLRSKGPNRCR
jgi:ArsR family transcriptional regulator